MSFHYLLLPTSKRLIKLFLAGVGITTVWATEDKWKITPQINTLSDYLQTQQNFKLPRGWEEWQQLKEIFTKKYPNKGNWLNNETQTASIKSKSFIGQCEEFLRKPWKEFKNNKKDKRVKMVSEWCNANKIKELKNKSIENNSLEIKQTVSKSKPEKAKKSVPKPKK